MVTASWSVADGRNWYRLRPRALGTVCLVLLWVAIRLVVAGQAPEGLCRRWAACVPASGAAWWAALLLASVYLVRFWPLAATVAAFTFAFADGWWSLFTGGYAVSRPLLDVVYAIACALHTLYVHQSQDRQRGYASARATPVPGEAALAPDNPRWGFVGAGAIFGAALASFPVVVLLFVVVRADDRAEVAGAWPTVAVCGLVIGAMVGWRRERRRLRAVRDPSGALSVDACLGLSRTVHVYAHGVDESFAQFRARPSPNANSPAADVGDILTGRLFGAAALKRASDRPPAPIILNLELPDHDGANVIATLAGSSPAPIIVTSARWPTRPHGRDQRRRRRLPRKTIRDGKPPYKRRLNSSALTRNPVEYALFTVRRVRSDRIR